MARGASSASDDAPGVRPLAVLLDVMPEQSQRAVTDGFGGSFDIAFARSTDPRELHELVRGATVLLAMWGAVDSSLIEAASEARVIQKLGIGTDKIDTDAAERLGIPVLKAAGINADAVAETTILLTLAVSRHLLKAVRESRAGHFEKEALRAETFQLTGRTVGLLGMGHIGQAVARRFSGFGVEIVYHDVVRVSADVEVACRATYVSFEELLQRSDIISLHVPSTPQTVGLFGAEAFACMKTGSILINTARGALVDEFALAEAVRSGKLVGAGLDVTEQEPLPSTSPLFDLERVVVTPHIAGAVGDNFPRVVQRAYDNVAALLEGRPIRAEDVVVWPESSR